jgi:hypothetical protein
VPTSDVPIYSSIPLLKSGSLEKTSDSMIVSGIDCEGRPTASCRKSFIDEADGKLDLLVEARQPACTCT